MPVAFLCRMTKTFLGGAKDFSMQEKPCTPLHAPESYLLNRFNVFLEKNYGNLNKATKRNQHGPSKHWTIGTHPASVSRCGAWSNVASSLIQNTATSRSNKLKSFLFMLLLSSMGKCTFLKNSTFKAWLKPVENNTFNNKGIRVS